jgi:hypothetical protein
VTAPDSADAAVCAAEHPITGILCARILCDGQHDPDGASPWGAPEPQAVAVSTRTAALITCPRCDHTWTATGAAHCSACHRLFSTPRLFDLHRSTRGGDHGSCADPAAITNRAGERVMLLRDGMWRGPQLSEEQREAIGWTA